MPTALDVLNSAKSHHAAGRLSEAEQLYRRLLEFDPSNVEVHYLFGAAAQGQGKYDEAAASLSQALRLRPDLAEAHHLLGIVLAQMGRAAEAIDCCRRAVQLKPDLAEAFSDLGTLLNRQRQFEEAIPCFRRVVQLQPDNSVARNELGVTLARAGKFHEAEALFRQIAEREPDNPRALLNLGGALSKLERYAEAADVGRRAVAMAPDDAVANLNLGAALERLGKLDEAESYCRRALAVRPGDFYAQNTLAAIAERRGNVKEAERLLLQGLEADVNDAESHTCYGSFLVRQARLSEARESFRQALRLAPNSSAAHACMATALLLSGEWAEGWAEHEWRWSAIQLQELLSEPRWTGEKIADGTILLHAEQGLGDTLQFVRYARMVKPMLGTLIVECQPQLASLVATCPGVDRVVARGEPLPKFGVYSPLLSLPNVFHTTVETIPAEVPYLFPDADLVARWRAELAGETRLKIGIAWRGSPGNVADRFRSFALREFAPIAATHGVCLYSLQFGAGREELAEVAGRWPIVDLGDRLGDFHNTAAIVRNLDLVITCDSAPLHLAGALGVPTWGALPHSADWRWLLDREDSPWYPTVRLFRKAIDGDWANVFCRIQKELAKLV